jgi:hypothetical protein
VGGPKNNNNNQQDLPKWNREFKKEKDFHITHV